MLCMMGKKFVDIAKVGEALKDCFMTGKILNLTTLQANEKATRTNDMNISKEKAEKVSMVTTTHMWSSSQRKYQNHNVNEKKFPCSNPKEFKPLKESQTQLYEGLKTMSMRHTIE